MPPRPEAIAAADWWANKLAQPPVHSLGRGAEQSSALANAATDMARRQHGQAEIDAFRQTLAEEIEKHIDDDSWRPENPLWGSYMRAIEVGYGPDAVFTDAAERAGFKLGAFDLPMKTVMWINPGLVKVAEGYNAQPVVIWNAEEGSTSISE